MQRSPSIFTLRIHIRTIGEKQFDDFLVTSDSIISRSKQRSHTIIILRIHIRTSSQVLFNGFDVSSSSSFVN